MTVAGPRSVQSSLNLATRSATVDAALAAARAEDLQPLTVAVLDAAGISGDTSDKDEYCAITAIRSAGLASAPPAPGPNWRG